MSKARPRLTLSVKGQTYTNGSKEEAFDWRNALIDAIIIALLTFFSTLAGTKTVGLPDIQALYSAFIAAMVQFFTILAMKRGIVRGSTKPVETEECK